MIENRQYTDTTMYNEKSVRQCTSFDIQKCNDNVLKSSDFASLSHLKPKASLGKQEDAAKDLYQRVLGPRAGEFVVKVQSNIGPKEKDTFLVRSTLIKIPTHQTLFPHLIPADTGKL